MNDLKERNTLANEVEKAMAETKRKQHLKMYDARIDELAALVEKTEQVHGPDYYSVKILTMFLDVAVRMKEAVTSLSSVDAGLALCRDAISFVERAMELESNVLSGALEMEKGLFARIRMKKIIKENVKALSDIAEGILAKHRMAGDVSRSLQGVSFSLRRLLQNDSSTAAKKPAAPAPAPAAEAAAPAEEPAEDYSAAVNFLAMRKAAK